MGVSSLPQTVTRQRRGCDLNPGPSVPESSMLTTRLPSHPRLDARAGLVLRPRQPSAHIVIVDLLQTFDFIVQPVVNLHNMSK